MILATAANLFGEPLSYGICRPSLSMFWRVFSLCFGFMELCFFLFLQSDSVVQNQLIVHGLERRHLHARLRCQASNNNLTQPIVASVQLDLNRQSRLSFLSFFLSFFLSASLVKPDWSSTDMTSRFSTPFAHRVLATLGRPLLLVD